MVDPSVTFFGPLDTLVGPYIEYVLLVLAIVSMVTRQIQHKSNVQQAESGDDGDLERHPIHTATMAVLVLAAFYYTTLHHHGGIVLSTLVLGTFIADIFEFEARKVEVREGHEFDRPNGAIVTSVLVLLYAAYQSVFVFIQPLWKLIV
jgi:hypothetical protein